MAARSWTISVCTALGVAAGAAAAQLGVGYGLNVIAWTPATDEGTARMIWLASLAWVAWLAATSTGLGAIIADRIAARPGESTEPPESPVILTVWRVVIALSAATGALIAVPLVAVPARLAPQANNATPQFTVGGYAIVGIIVGIIVAVSALHVRAIATNVMISAAWMWALAVASVAYGLQQTADPATAQLATWQFGEGQGLRGMVSLPSALLMLGAAFVLGGLAAWRAGRRGDHRVGVALSGVTGPLLVTAAYLLALPGVEGSLQQLSASVMAPYTVIAGLAGSGLVSALGPAGRRRRARAAQEVQDEQTFEEWQRGLAADSPESSAKTPATGSPAKAKPSSSGRAAGPAGPASGEPSETPTIDLSEDGTIPSRGGRGGRAQRKRR